MKIQGPNGPNINPYNQILKKQHEMKQQTKKEDQLQISEAAKNLLEIKEPNTERIEKIAKLKAKVENNEYEIEFEKTAKKMIDFWSNKR